MFRLDRSVATRLQEAQEMRREMVDDCPITGPKDQAKTFYWDDEDQIFADAIRLEMAADLSEGENRDLARRFREEARIRREFLRNPAQSLRDDDEQEVADFDALMDQYDPAWPDELVG